MNGLRLNPQLLRVPLYVAGKSAEQACQEIGLDQVIKLCSNENPLGPSPMALAALQDALAEAHRYPGIAEYELRLKLAAHHGRGFTEGHLIVGNGATDVLRMVAQAFIFPSTSLSMPQCFASTSPGEAVMCKVAFPLYALLTTMYGGKPVCIAPRPDYRLDLPAMAAAITADTRIVWLCSPNNPTGLILSPEETDAFMDHVPDHIVVVFDEAYWDFVTCNCVDSTKYVLEGRNAIVVRSFSKSGGLAGLRLGYGIARPEIIEYLLHTVMPFNTGAPTIAAAAASLDDHAFHRHSRELVEQERDLLYARLSEMGLTCLPSQGNFVLLLDPPLGMPVLVDALLHQGIIVRPMAGFGLPNALRVSIGLPEQNRRFLTALHAVLAKEAADELTEVATTKDKVMAV